MERPLRYQKGDVVVFHFPFTDSPETKKRPSLVVAALRGDNVILAQITSQPRPDPDIIVLKHTDFEKGKLKKESYIRPSILFTLHASRIEYRAGKLKAEKIKEIQKKLIEIFSR